MFDCLFYSAFLLNCSIRFQEETANSKVIKFLFSTKFYLRHRIVIAACQNDAAKEKFG